MCMQAVHHALAKMLLSSKEYRNEAFAMEDAGQVSLGLSGLNKDGTFFVTTILDQAVAGCGALPDMDGVDTGGDLWTPKAQMANIEMNELLYPIMYLQRKENADTGGIGKFRGGVAFCSALISWDTPAKELNCLVKGMGTEPRESGGFSGGYPGANTLGQLVRNADVLEKLKRGKMVKDIRQITGDKKTLPSVCTFTLGEKDVLLLYEGNGGGYGDPIDRDPELVLKDVINGYVSHDLASEAYGIVIDSKKFQVDSKKTKERRKEIVEERLKVGRR